MKNRAKLLKWIDANHPELNGFLLEQNEQVGLKYIEAIDLCNESN